MMEGQNKLIFVFLLLLLAFECLVYAASSSRGCLPNPNAKKKVSKPVTSQLLGFIVGVEGYAYEGGTVSKSSKRFGDDAWFHATRPDAEALGIADGVSSWGKDENISNSSKFSTTLMNKCAKLFKEKLIFQLQSAELTVLKNYKYDTKMPTELLKPALDYIIEKKVYGGSTACVIIFEKAKRMLYTANIGDTGFLVVRNDQLIRESEQRIYRLNCPFQFFVPPKSKYDLHSEYVKKNLKQNQIRLDDTAKDEFKVEEGDVIMLATNGVFHNVHKKALIIELAKIYGEKDQKKIYAAAKTIADLAYKNSQDPNFESPAQIATANGPVKHFGGRPDDITVVVATIIAK